MGMDRRERGLRALLSCPAWSPPRTDANAARPHDRVAGNAWLRAHLRHWRHPGRPLPGLALWDHFWHADVGSHPGWGRRALGDRHAARRHWELHSGLLDRHRVQRTVGRGYLARRTAEGTGRRRPRPSVSVPAVWT